MKRPYKSDLIKRMHAKIQEEFMRDQAYVFTCQDFNNLAETDKEKRNIRSDLWRRSNPKRKDAQLFKIVGKRDSGWRRPLTLYAPIDSPLSRLDGDKKQHFERILTEKDEQIIDSKYKRKAEQTPAPVIDLHNILFNFGRRK